MRVSTIVEYIRVVKIIDRKVPVLSTKDTLDLYLYFTQCSRGEHFYKLYLG